LKLPGAGCCRFSTQETFAAVNRTALGRFEGNRRFPPALRANGRRFRSLCSGTRRSLPFGLARLAAFGFILEILVVEEMLLSRGKYELCPAIRALDDSILKLRHHHRSHGPTQATLLTR